jgi:predicted permease
MKTADFRFALRRLSRSPGFSITVILLLGLAFAANAGVFSVIYGLLYKPLPFAQSERLVELDTRLMGLSFNAGVSAPYLLELAQHAKTLQGVSGYREEIPLLQDDAGRPIVSLHASRLQPSVFTLLGAQAAAGRLLGDEDTATGAAASLLVSADYARAHYANTTAAIGARMRLEGTDFRIVGVLPDDFHFPSRNTEVWLPLAFSEQERAAQRGTTFNGLRAIARLAPEQTLAAATSEITTLANGMEALKEAFATAGLQIRALPLRTLWLGDRRPALELMLLAVMMVLLVTTANVCNLFIARLFGRQHEAALLDALGAGPWQRLRQTFAEALLLCASAAMLGFALLPGSLILLRHFDLLPNDAPQAIGIDLATLLFVAALATLIATAMAACDLWFKRTDLHEGLKQGGLRHTASRGAQRARATLIMAQIAMTAALLTATGLLLRSSQRLLAEDVGFDRDHLVFAHPDVLMSSHGDAQKTLLHSLVERARALPGVTHVGVGNMTPFGSGASVNSFTPPDHEDIQPQPAAYHALVDAEYFAALGAPIVRGRAFTADEARAKSPVAIVDQTFVDRYLDGRDPIGQRLRVGIDDGSNNDSAMRELTIVGIAATVKQKALDETADRVFIYQPDAAPPEPTLLLRTQIAPETLLQPLEHLLKELAPLAPGGEIISMRSRIADTLRDRERLNTLLQLLGLIALGLASVGLYAVLAYTVRQRSTEFGIRMALGASSAQLQRAVIGQGLRWVGGGLLLGAPLAWALVVTLSSRLYRIGPFDPPTLIVIVLMLGSIGLAACWWPASRAASTDPMVALRNE